MGLHTWFYKNKELYKETIFIYDKLDELEEQGSDDMILFEKYHNRLSEIDKLNDAEYHDCFRTSKREPDGSYTTDVLYSKEECLSWLEENSDKVMDLDLMLVHQFWNKYPNGVIDFG